MKYLSQFVAIVIACCVFSSCNSSSTRSTIDSKIVEIPRIIGGVELLAPVSQYPQFEEAGGFPEYTLLDGVKEYYNPSAEEFEPKYVGVKDGRIVYIAVMVYGASHVEAAEKEIAKYGNGSDGRTFVEARPTDVSPYTYTVIDECIVYVDASYKKEIDSYTDKWKQSREDELKRGLDKL